MKRSLIVLAAVGLLAGIPGWAGADEPASKEVHRGAGIVVALSPGEITLKEGEGFHRLTVDTGTRTVIAPDDRVSRLGVGDYVAEECGPGERGGVIAKKLTLYRPAWLEIASPEN